MILFLSIVRLNRGISASHLNQKKVKSCSGDGAACVFPNVKGRVKRERGALGIDSHSQKSCVRAVSVCSADYLTSADLIKVMNSICEAKIKWYNLGLELGIHHGELDVIKENEYNRVDQCFKGMLILWLKTLTPSWEDLVKALKGPMVGHLQLANSIAAEHSIQGFGKCTKKYRS